MCFSYGGGKGQRKIFVSTFIFQITMNYLKIVTMERKRSRGFRRNLTIAFLLFLAPAGRGGGSNPTSPISYPAGQSLTFA